MIAQLEHRFTSEAYHRMGETGVLSPKDRVELLDGRIINMSPMVLFTAAS